MIPKDLKPIPDFPDYYARKDGTIWSVKPCRNFARNPNKPRQIKWGLTHYGHRQVSLYVGDKRISKKISVLMLTTFISPRPKGMFACHGINGKSDDSLNNLYWATPQQNALDRHRDGTACLGEKNNKTKLNELQVRIIRRAYAKHKTRRTKIIDVFGLSLRQLADVFNVNRCTIYDIVSRKNWKYI